MKANFLKTTALAVITAAAFTGCVNDDDYAAPDLNCVDPGLTATKTPAEILAAAPASPTLYTQDDVIEAYVISSDERGNFFKVVYLQTLPVQGTNPVGFSVAIDDTTLFGEDLYPGRKVFIKLKDLYFARVENALSIGALYNGAIGRISQFDYHDHVIPACEEVSEEQLVRHLTLTEALSNANLNTLIEIDGVQFGHEYVGGTYFDEDDEENTAGGATNRPLVDEPGNAVAYRTSSFANFSGDEIPENSGSVRGILTKYDGVFQFMSRSAEDIKLDEPRFVSQSPTAKGGLNVAFAGSLNETFESYTVDQQAFPNYVNEYLVGGRYWELTQFGGNKYIEMTSFAGSGSPGVTARTFFFVPVDFTAANTFTFSKEIRYMAGEALKVYYVTEENYTARSVFDVDTFVEITSEFDNLNYPATGTSQNTFTTAGTYNIPASLSGNGFFVFEYHGGNGVTTTIQIDNIVIN